MNTINTITSQFTADHISAPALIVIVLALFILAITLPSNNVPKIQKKTK